MKMNIKSLLIILVAPFVLFGQSQPNQALIGPGSSDYIHGGVTEYFKDSASLSYWIYEPSQPRPDTADLVVFLHGMGQINPMIHAEWITHLVKKGNIVVYPKYQDDLNVSTDSFMSFASQSIKMSIAKLKTTGHVTPNLDHFAIIGHSYGGAIAANLTYDYMAYDIPKVKALMVAQGYYGTDMLLPTYVNFPYDTKIQLVVGNDDTTVEDDFGRLLMDSANVNPAFKNLITHYADPHGFPSVTARHDDPTCISPSQDYNSGQFNYWVVGAQFLDKVDVTDYYCYWKLSEALLNCTFYNTNCEYAFGDTPEQRFMGQWSDSTAIVELTVEPNATVSTHLIQDKTLAISLYPNPSSDFVQIEVEELIEEAIIQLFSPLGQLLLEEKGISLETGYKIDLPTANGFYYLKIQQGNAIYTSKILKLE
jgi:predicted esterase